MTNKDTEYLIAVLDVMSAQLGVLIAVASYETVLPMYRGEQQLSSTISGARDELVKAQNKRRLI